MKIDEKKLKNVSRQALKRHQDQEYREEKNRAENERLIIERKAMKTSEAKRKIRELFKSERERYDSDLQTLRKLNEKTLPLFYKNRDMMDYAINRAMTNTQSRMTTDVWHELLKLAQLPDATRPEAMTGIVSKRGIQYKKEGKLLYFTREALNMRFHRRVNAHEKAVSKMIKRTDAHGS